MSINCIKCMKRKRTGADLLCDECRVACDHLTPKTFGLLSRWIDMTLTVALFTVRGPGMSEEEVANEVTAEADRLYDRVRGNRSGKTAVTNADRRLLVEATLARAAEMLSAGSLERCGFVPPTPGYAPCKRAKGHDGPCAHELAGGLGG